MLFDLQGKRRRVVQATYVTLAVLMGAGLVLFGIGGSVSGGLLDAFSGGGDGGANSDVVEERVERNETRIKRRPRDEEARKELVRDYYSLAFAQTPDDATTFSADAKDELEKASVHWDAYLELTKGKPDPSVARVALQVYDPTALNKPDQALQAARIIAARGKDPASYLQLVQYAVLADDARAQKEATAKALSSAHGAEERNAVRAQLKEIQKAAITRQVQQGDIQLDGAAPAGGKGKSKQDSGAK